MYKAPVTHCHVYWRMPTVEDCFIFIAILGKKVGIYIFLRWVDGDNGFWWLSMVCCSEYPTATQWVGQGGLRKPDRWSGIVQGAWGRCQGAWERCQGTRGTAKEGLPWGRYQGGSRMLEGWQVCSVVHPYYYCDHNTWPQIYGKLWMVREA